jgi:hypothetical protein
MPVLPLRFLACLNVNVKVACACECWSVGS